MRISNAQHLNVKSEENKINFVLLMEKLSFHFPSFIFGVREKFSDLNEFEKFAHLIHTNLFPFLL
jgi:hypothetical protein